MRNWNCCEVCTFCAAPESNARRLLFRKGLGCTKRPTNCFSLIYYTTRPYATAPSFVPNKNVIQTITSKNVRSIYNNGASSSSSHPNKNAITMMPIGVPKVAYRVPGSQSADWYVPFISALASVIDVLYVHLCTYVCVYRGAPLLSLPLLLDASPFPFPRLQPIMCKHSQPLLHNPGSTFTIVCTGNALFSLVPRLTTSWPIK